MALLILPSLTFAQSEKFIGKWKFNVDLVKKECADWIKTKDTEVKTLKGEEQKALKKELNMVKQIEGSLNFSYSGLVYHFKEDSVLKILSTKGGVGGEITYELKNGLLYLNYPQLKQPVMYRYEFKDEKLYIYEISNGVERFGQVLEPYLP